MSIRITDATLDPDNKTILVIRSVHGGIRLDTDTRIQLALGHTGIQYIPPSKWTTEFLRTFLVGRLAYVDKKHLIKGNADFIKQYKYKLIIRVKKEKKSHAKCKPCH